VADRSAGCRARAKMFFHLDNPQDRADVIAYLKERANKCGPRAPPLSNSIAEQRFREIVPSLDDATRLPNGCRIADDAEDIVQDAADTRASGPLHRSVDRPKTLVPPSFATPP